MKATASAEIIFGWECPNCGLYGEDVSVGPEYLPMRSIDEVCFYCEEEFTVEFPNIIYRNNG